MVQYYYERVSDMRKFYKPKYIYLIELAIISVQIILVIAVMHNNEKHAVERGKHLLCKDCAPKDFKENSGKHKLATKLVDK